MSAVGALGQPEGIEIICPSTRTHQIIFAKDQEIQSGGANQN
jgi:hypothetical protein